MRPLPGDDQAIRRLIAVAAVATLPMAVAGCGGAPSSSPTSTKTATASATPSTRADTASTGRQCPLLSAEVPADFVGPKVHVSPGMGSPSGSGYIWTGPAGRGLSIGSEPTNEPYGDGSSAVPATRRVQGTDGTEIVVKGVHKITWKSPSATSACIYWSAVTEGLTAEELDKLLSTVHEE